MWNRFSSQNNLLWNKRNVILQSFNEETEKVDYIFKNLSFKFYIRKNDLVSNQIRVTHFWPDCGKLYQLWDTYQLWKYKYFIDVGANIGSCSLISKSILCNKKYKSNFSLYMIGLSNEKNKRTIYINHNNWGASSLHKRTHFPELINIYRLDDVNVNVKDGIGMMKIDVECHELPMIEGGINFIRNNFIKVIYFEQYCNCYSNNITRHNDIYFILSSLGYSVLNRLDCRKEYGGKDIIAIR